LPARQSRVKRRKSCQIVANGLVPLAALTLASNRNQARPSASPIQVSTQFRQHVARRNIVGVVVSETLQLGQMANRAHVVPSILRTRSAIGSVATVVSAE